MFALAYYQDRHEFELTEGEISKFLTTFDFIALFHGSFDTANHHSTDTHCHDTTELRTIDWYYPPNVFSINI